MKKLLLPWLAILLLLSCKKQIPNNQVAEENTSLAAKRGTNKMDVCHREGNGNWHVINISINAWPAHQGHGDIRVDDQDGDGYVLDNACSFGQMGDCNDTNATVHPSAVEICDNGIDENCNGQIDENCFVIGDNYQGGKIAYILHPGDPGYIANETHDLIAAASDQSTGAEWGCWLEVISGADGTALGTGNQNTIDIMAGCATSGIAARICGDLVLNGYSDWYLPSRDELNILRINSRAIGRFGPAYWSSSENENDHNGAWGQDFDNGFYYNVPKNIHLYVRAVRAF